MLLLYLKTCQWLFISYKVRAKFLAMTHEVYMIWLHTLPLWDSVTVPLSNTVSAPWPPCCSLSILDTLPLDSLCTCFLCLGWTSCRYLYRAFYLEHSILFFFNIYLFILAALGLGCCMQALSSCSVLASYSYDFSCEAWALGTCASVIAIYGLSSHSSWAQ